MMHMKNKKRISEKKLFLYFVLITSLLMRQVVADNGTKDNGLLVEEHSQAHQEELEKDQYSLFTEMLTKESKGAMIWSGSKKVLKESAFALSSLVLGATVALYFNMNWDNFETMSFLKKNNFIINFKEDGLKKFALIKIFPCVILSSIASYFILKIICKYLYADKNQQKDNKIVVLEKLMGKWQFICDNVPQDLREIFEPLYLKYLINQKQLSDLSEVEAGNIIEKALKICLAKSEFA